MLPPKCITGYIPDEYGLSWFELYVDSNMFDYTYVRGELRDDLMSFSDFTDKYGFIYYESVDSFKMGHYRMFPAFE
jgi:hypothetical protein